LLHTTTTRVRGFVVGGLALGALVTGATAANAAVVTPAGAHEPVHVTSASSSPNGTRINSTPDTREGVVAPAGTRVYG
jgi:hypothetical protein